ncbi:MAG: adenosylmethionine decarboxylase [Candidatus Aenigmarchaeota archaeon]|nr:adenosylmethionine decarboxylase [Candidatus Aenigmarchaeota archaeon]
MKPLGIHLISEFLGCSAGILNDEKMLEKTLKDGIKKCGMSLKSINSHQFSPLGVTVAAIIGESHILIHTYPEARHASVDIFTCSGHEAQKRLLSFLKGKLKPKTVKSMEIRRGNTIEAGEKNIMAAFTPAGRFFDVKYHAKKHIFSKKSKYQQIDIIENENFGRMLFLDRDIQVTEKDADVYNRALVNPVIGSGKPGKAAILGGGDGGVLCELLKHNPENVFLVDIDREVVEASRKFLQSVCKSSFNDKRTRVVIEDANKFLETNSGFDAIIYDLTLHPELIAKTGRDEFLEKIFFRIGRSLNRDGVISMQCCSSFDKETFQRIKKILPRHFRDVKFKEVFIPSFCEYWIFASAVK